MSEFNTHGGYFAPNDYFRINTGGSHDENPNGGVQVGVDEQGTPNVLEEGEPVYKDFVFSDNIKASERFLKQFNIPIKFAGKLYSEIADSFVEEAKERPLDHTSNKGLEAMLGRLADAQEAQKDFNDTRAIKRELNNLTPEELMELEAILQQPQEQQEEIPVEEAQAMPVSPDMQEAVPQEQVPAQPMMPMAYGGLLHRFDGGGPTDDDPPFAVRDNTMTTTTQGNGYVPRPVPEVTAEDIRSSLENQSMVPYVGIPANAALIGDYIEEGDYGNAAWEAALLGAGLVPFGGAFARATGRLMKPVARGIGRGVRAIGRGLLKTPKLLEFPARKQMVSDAAKSAKSAMQAAKTAADEANEIAKELKLTKASLKADPTNAELIDKVSTLEAKSVDADKAALKASGEATAKSADVGVKSVGALTTGPLYNKAALKKEIDGLEAAYKAAKEAADAAPTDEALKKAAEVAEKELEKAKGFWNKWWKHGEWQIKAPVGIAAGTTALLLNDQAEDKKWSDNFLEQFNNSDSFVAPNDTTRAVTDTTRAAVDTTAAANADSLSINDYINSFIDYYGNNKCFGGPINRYDGGGWADFLKQLNGYKVSLNPGNTAGKYRIDRRFPLSGYKTIKELEDSDAYRAFTDYVLANSSNTDVQNYLRALDAGTAAGVEKLFNCDTLKDNWQDLYRNRRYDQKGGIYHFSGNNEIFNPSAYPTTDILNAASRDIDNQIQIDTAERPESVPVGPVIPSAKAVPLKAPGFMSGTQVSRSPSNGQGIGPFYPTFPRFAGAIGAGALALHNIATPPDRYIDTRVPAYTPEGHINLQDIRYNPIDQNMIQNQILAQGNSTQRALGNSGLGSSSGAAILAADNNTTGNLGTGFIQGWQANNQQRSAVTAANNQAEAQRAQFDYTVDAARKRAMQDAAWRNAQNDLMVQRLNYAAEGERYNAISQQIDNALSALSDIGRENFAMNQVNSNTALGGYHTGSNGWGYYSPYFNPIMSLLKNYNG